MLHTLPPETSIKKRLLVYLSIGLGFFWLLSSIISLGFALHELNESTDSQMIQLARSIPHISPSQTVLLPEIEDSLGKNNIGSAQNQHNGIAVWAINGHLLLADDKGRSIPFQTASGFVDTAPIWQTNSWRILYLHHPESGQTVAISQHWRERLAMLLNTVWVQILSSLLSLPFLAWLLHQSINRSLQPLNELANELSHRQADNLNPVSLSVPQETQTLVTSLNHLFARVQNTINREQRFTSDASHELRSPLTALKVQTEACALSNQEEQPYHFMQIQKSLARAEHLINQLLTLSRLDPKNTVQASTDIDWQTLSHQALQDINLLAREKHIQLKRELLAPQPFPLKGEPTLLLLLLRNLLDNAIRYSPPHSEVSLHLHSDCLEIRDNGLGIAPEHLPQIKERFYRPAGQNEQGSGLGLSIAEQIAQLHHLNIRLHNRNEGGLSVWIEYKKA